MRFSLPILMIVASVLVATQVGAANNTNNTKNSTESNSNLTQTLQGIATGTGKTGTTKSTSSTGSKELDWLLQDIASDNKASAEEAVQAITERKKVDKRTVKLK